jgi:hypothetical protein
MVEIHLRKNFSLIIINYFKFSKNLDKVYKVYNDFKN